MSKATGLAAFTRKGTTAVEQEKPVGEGVASEKARGRGKGDVVALTVRLPRAEWERVHQLAVAEGVSIQALAVEGLSKVFADKGLPKLST
jgi:hypothetical protein